MGRKQFLRIKWNDIGSRNGLPKTCVFGYRDNGAPKMIKMVVYLEKKKNTQIIYLLKILDDRQKPLTMLFS